MRYKLECTKCGATAWASGDNFPDPETGAVEIKDDSLEWELPGLIINRDSGEQVTDNGCEHSEYDVVDSEWECDADA